MVGHRRHRIGGARWNWASSTGGCRLRLKVNASARNAGWICETGDEWNWRHLIFRLEARGAGALLRCAHAGWRAETAYFTSRNTTWGEMMFQLKAAAEGKPRGALFQAAAQAY